MSLLCHLRCPCQCLLILIFFMALNRGIAAGLYPSGSEGNLNSALSYFADVVYKAGSKTDFPSCGTIPELYYLFSSQNQDDTSVLFLGKHIWEGDQFGNDGFIPIIMGCLNIFFVKLKKLINKPN